MGTEAEDDLSWPGEVDLVQTGAAAGKGVKVSPSDADKNEVSYLY